MRFQWDYHGIIMICRDLMKIYWDCNGILKRNSGGNSTLYGLIKNEDSQFMDCD